MALLNNWDWDGVSGNHEGMLYDWLNNKNRNKINAKFGSGISIATKKLTQEVASSLFRMPKKTLLEIDGCKVLLCHGSPWDRDEYIYPDANEDIVNNPTAVNFPDFSAGFIGYSENLFFGFAAHHLTQPNQGFISESQLPTKLTAHIGANIPLSRYRNSVTTISPNFLYQKQQDFQQFNYGVYVNRGPIVGGLWARHSVKNVDSFILMVGLIQDAFKFGYSYDITLSNLKNSNTLGAHELSFTLFMPCRSRSKSFNTISCPSF